MTWENSGAETVPGPGRRSLEVHWEDRGKGSGSWLCKGQVSKPIFRISELSRILQCSRTPTLAKVQNTKVQGHIPSPARLSSPLTFNPPQSGYSIFSLLQNFSFPTNLFNVNIPQKSILFSVNILVSEHTYPPHDLISHPSTGILKSTFPA